jgi:hypothetical protein
VSSIYEFDSGNGGEYFHFRSDLENFYNNSGKYIISSINNHALDLSKFGDKYRITRFIRDPRDMIVSGYFYHKKGSEKWCNILNPSTNDWNILNGNRPDGMLKDQTYSTYLNSIPMEEGLIAEIQLRRKHLDSMRKWPQNNSRIRLFKYEDILSNEGNIFEEIFNFYELPVEIKNAAKETAKKLSASNLKGKSAHIRNPNPEQWKEHFTSKVKDYFDQNHGDLIRLYDYNK